MNKSCLALIVCWLAGCEGSSEKLGTESHFLESCAKTSECGSLQCIEGRCTKKCDSDDVCDALEADAVAQSWLGPTLAQAYLMHKRGEIAMLKDREPSEVLQVYREAY